MSVYYFVEFFFEFMMIFEGVSFVFTHEYFLTEYSGSR